MSRKATRVSRAVNEALGARERAKQEEKAAARVARLAREAADSAAVAACAAERASVCGGRGRLEASVSVLDLCRQAEAATKEAVERAREAMRAEDEGDVAAAVLAAGASEAAARRAASLSTAASVMVGKARGLASGVQAQEPSLGTEDTERTARAEAKERERQLFAAALDRSARFLLSYGGTMVATFSREDDAMLLEAELCQIDLDRGVRNAFCKVVDRRGNRVGGYLIAGDRLVTYLRDAEFERRFG